LLLTGGVLQIKLRGRLNKEQAMLAAALIILLLWLLGFSFHVAGGFIHLLLIIGVIMLLIHLFNRGGRTNTTV
jgi:hypothetical protein